MHGIGPIGFQFVGQSSAASALTGPPSTYSRPPGVKQQATGRAGLARLRKRKSRSDAHQEGTGERTFKALRVILKKHAGHMRVTTDTDNLYYVDAGYSEKWKKAERRIAGVAEADAGQVVLQLHDDLEGSDCGAGRTNQA